MKCEVLLVFLSFLSSMSCKQAKFEFVEEWKMWKTTHDKSYTSQRDEIEKHCVWLSNKEYIDQHNANAHLFGYTLALNHLGDMVSMRAAIIVCLGYNWLISHDYYLISMAFFFVFTD